MISKNRQSLDSGCLQPSGGDRCWSNVGNTQRNIYIYIYIYIKQNEIRAMKKRKLTKAEGQQKTSMSCALKTE